MSDFRQMKWQARNSTNSVPQLQIAPRVSMIIGLDTFGSVYLSLMQSNSNSKIMEIFIVELIKKLDSERADWRKNTVIMFDNAPYHTNPATLRVLEN